jgi:hypothetical protein
MLSYLGSSSCPSKLNFYLGRIWFLSEEFGSCHLELPLLSSGGDNNALILGPYPTPNKKKRGRDLRESSVSCGERKKSSHSFEA